MTNDVFLSGRSFVSDTDAPAVDLYLDPDEFAIPESGYPPLYDARQALFDVRECLEKERQVLSFHFPELARATYDHGLVEALERRRVSLPVGAERLMLVPRWQVYFSRDYWAATRRVLTVLREKYLFRAVKDTGFLEVHPGNLHQDTRSVLLYKMLGEKQARHNLLVVPVQLGRRFGGYSVQSVQRALLKTNNEAGLGILEMALFLMCHPDRLADYKDLWIDCPGSIVQHKNRLGQSFTLRFNSGLQVRLASFDEADGRSGAATMFHW